MKKELGQFSYIKNMLAEQKAYKRAKRKELFIEVANWSSVILLGAIVAFIIWIAFIY